MLPIFDSSKEKQTNTQQEFFSVVTQRLAVMDHADNMVALNRDRLSKETESDDAKIIPFPSQEPTRRNHPSYAPSPTDEPQPEHLSMLEQANAAVNDAYGEAA